MNFNQEQILQAINIVYIQGTNDNQEQFKQAEKYLIQFERSKEAWVVCLQILNQDNHAEQTYFSCSKALKTKLQFDIEQLAEQDQQQLFDQLIIVVTKHKKVSRNIRIQLALSFIYYYMHKFQLIGDILKFLQTTFYQISELQMFVLNIFEFFPDEIDNEDVVIDDEKRRKLKVYIKSEIQEKIIKELHNIYQAQKGQEYQLMKCFTKWVDFDSNDALMSFYPNHSILMIAFQSLQDDALQSKAADCIISVLRQIKDPHKQINLFQMIASQVFSFFDRCRIAIQNESYDEVQEYLRIFVRFGKVAMSDFIENISPQSITFFNKMLELSQLPEQDNSDEINEFWSKLIKTLQNQQVNKNEKIAAFTHLLAQLINVFVIRIRLSNDHFKQYQSKDQENYKEEYEIKQRERHSMVDLIQQISDLIGLEPVLLHLSQLIQQVLQPNPNVDALQSCIIFEAPLYAISHILFLKHDEKKNLTPAEITIVQQIVYLIVQMNSTYIRIRKTALNIITSTGRQLGQDAYLVKQVFEFVAICLADPLTKQNASKAFETVCMENKQFVRDNLENFFVLFTNMCDNDNIVSGLAVAISGDPIYLEKYLNMLCKPFCNKLEELLQLSDEGRNNNNITKLMGNQLDKITLIVRSVPQVPTGFPHTLIQNLYKEIWPVLQFIMQQCKENERLIEKTCRVIKHSMRCLDKDFSIFLRDMLEHIVFSFQTTIKPISSYLYIIEVSITVFHRYPEECALLQVAYTKMTELTIQKIPQLSNFEEEPELVEDFFGMQARILKYSPQFFLCSQQIENVINLANVGIGIQHKEASKALYTFIEWLYDFFFESYTDKLKEDMYNQVIMQQYKVLNNILAGNISGQITHKLMMTLIDVPPKSVREYIYDVFLAQIKTFTEQSKVWMKNVFDQLGEGILTESEKEKILNLIKKDDEKCSDYREEQLNYREEQLIDMFNTLGRRCKQNILRSNEY